MGLSEDREQMLVVEWCRKTDWKRRSMGVEESGIGAVQHGGVTGIGNVFHIPNGGWRSKSEAAKLKAMGVVKGVADLFVPVVKVEQGEGVYGVRIAGGRVIGGLWIEMKVADGGRLGKEQAEFGERMVLAGYCYVVAHGHQEAIEAIKRYAGVEDGVEDGD